MLRNKDKSAFLLLFLFWAQNLRAKGLDNLNPEVKKEPQAKEEPQSAKPDEKKPEEKPGEKDEKAKEVGTGEEKKPEEKPTAEKPKEVSAVSAALADKLAVSTSFALIRAKAQASGRTWASSGLTDIALTYLLDKKLFDKAMHVGLRYAPLAVSLRVKKDGLAQEYKGVVENYLVGMKLDHDFNEKRKAYGTFELGLYRQNFAVDGDFASENPADDQKFGILLAFGAGLDFKFGDRFACGPNAYLGLGGYTLFQLGAKFSFVF